MLLLRTSQKVVLGTVENNINLYTKAGSPKDARNVYLINSANKGANANTAAVIQGAPWKGGSIVYFENQASVYCNGGIGVTGTTGSAGAGGTGGNGGISGPVPATPGSSGSTGGSGGTGGTGGPALVANTNSGTLFLVKNSGIFNGGTGGPGGPGGPGGGGGGGGGSGALV